MVSDKLKIIILTDSIANPRSFPVEASVSLEKTYPYLLRDEFPDSIFWQLSYGDRTTEDLANQAISYLNDWEPDYIIVQSGIIDCRPEAFTQLQKSLINSFTGPFFRYLKKHMYNPRLIKYRNMRRVTPNSYKKTLKKLQFIFNDSKILISEVFCGFGYESARPGIKERIEEFNRINSQIYKDNVIKLHERLNSEAGFNADNFHLNEHGHLIVADEIIRKIRSQSGI